MDQLVPRVEIICVLGFVLVHVGRMIRSAASEDRARNRASVALEDMSEEFADNQIGIRKGSLGGIKVTF
jgi:hypothetical protein